jgi:hypothetical protein
VYDPATPARLVTSVAFYRGRTRALETKPVEVTDVSGGRKAVFQLDLPAASLRPGLYTCQVNVVDDTGGTFAFPRFPLYVR